MDRRHFLQFAATLPAAAASGAAFAAPQRPLHPDWSIVDRRKLGSGTTIVSFIHRSGIDSAEALGIMAVGRTIPLKSVKLTYRGGAKQVHQFDLSISPGTFSPTIALTGGSSLLRRIDIAIGAAPSGPGAEILVWSEPAVDQIHTATE